MNRHHLLSFILACATASACGSSQSSSKTPELQPAADPVGSEPTESVAARAPKAVQVSLAEVGLDAAAMDRSVDPCTDFFQYSCGGWLKSTEIPVDKSRYGRFSEVHERNEKVLHEILEAARAAEKADPVTAKLGQFYGACMDEAAIEKAKLTGIEPLLGAARGVKKAKDVPRVVTELHRHGIWAVFASAPEADFKDSTRNILFVDTAGLGLPDRDYYLSADKPMVDARTFYRGHVERMFQLAGMKPAAARKAADDVLTLETELAKVTKTRTERQDVPALYNKIDRKGLAERAPSFDWATYFAAFGRGDDLQDISVTTPDYFNRFEALLGSVKPAAWSSYLQWQILHAMADSLPKAFVDEGFALTRALTDQPEIEPRWKRCVQATDESIGELLGQGYVAARFAGNSKDAANDMIREISRAFAGAVAELDWMSEATRKQAMAKLDKMSSLIGYPERWKTYDFEIDRGNYARSVLGARVFETRRQMDKPGKPVDRREWLMTPQTVNAYYNPLANQMAFPAGILQSPFFGAERSVAANLGAIGMVVGHELTHGFDDSGAKFDDVGNMRNWWQDQDAAKFEAKGQCLVDQYSTFEPLPGLKLNGKLTLGENIADLGGVKLAFRAYRAMRKSADKRYVAEGLTEDQIFFVATGQAWCTKAREAEIRRRVVVDTHSPPEFRVNGTLRNTPEFAAAFKCAKGTQMNPAKTCAVW